MSGLAAALTLSAPALAEPGDHIRAGEVEIAPDIDVGAEYRTNVFREEVDPIPAANMRFAPGVLVSAGGEDHDFRASGEWVLRKYFFVGQNDTFIEESDQVGNLDRLDEFSIAAGADTFKRSVVGFRLADDMELRNFTADCEFCDTPYLSQFRNSLGAGVRINPGAALQVVPGARWTFDSFRIPATDGSDRGFNNRNTYGPMVEAKWSFLPRTAVVANAEWMVNSWQFNVLEDAALPNSNQIKGVVGIDGRFTEKVLAQVMLGYGVGTFNEDTVVGNTAAAVDATGLDGLILRTQLRYLLTPSEENRAGSSVTAGYVRDFRPSFFTNYLQLNQVFADLHARLGPVEPSLRYDLRFENYNGLVDRSDTVNKFTGDVRVPASDWASFTAGGWWQQRASTDFPVEYDDFNLHALATFVY
ncbi:MAG: hypothetical protein ABMA64_32885 [Myxococcota bacterium]